MVVLAAMLLLWSVTSSSAQYFGRDKTKTPRPQDLLSIHLSS
jgi:hypothetical protein